jgi:hypothetical protein
LRNLRLPLVCSVEVSSATVFDFFSVIIDLQCGVVVAAYR